MSDPNTPRLEWMFEGAFPGGGRKLTPEENATVVRNTPLVTHYLRKMNAGQMTFDEAMAKISALKGKSDGEIAVLMSELKISSETAVVAQQIKELSSSS